MIEDMMSFTNQSSFKSSSEKREYDSSNNVVEMSKKRSQFTNIHVPDFKIEENISTSGESHKDEISTKRLGKARKFKSKRVEINSPSMKSRNGKPCVEY